MWEVTLIGKTRDIIYFEELRNNLTDLFGKDVLVAITYNRELVCSVATANKKYINLIENAVFETILKVVKSEYFMNNLTIFGDDKSLNAFVVSSLVIIDLIDEIEYARENSRLTKKVSMRSFVFFRLKKLIDIWEKIVSYLNINYSNELQEDLYLDFLKFLAENSQSKSDIMYLEEEKNEMQLLDKEKNMISSIPKSDEIGIIVNLIMFAPRKLIINCIDSLSTKVSNMISYIFEDRVSVLL